MNFLKKYWKIGLIILIVALIAANLNDRPRFASSVNDFATSELAYESDGYAGDFEEAEFMDESLSRSQSITATSSPVPEQPPAADRQVIQTGNLNIIVEDVEATVKDLRKTAEEKWNGFVSSANVSQLSDESRSGWITLRVPAGEFNSIIEEIKELAIRVQSENTNAEDVTRQIADSEARLKNLQVQEEQYRDILGRAGTIEDTLKAAEQLNRVRVEIERLDAQLKVTKDQVALSTLTVSLSDEGEVSVFGVYWRPIVQIKQALRDAIENATEVADYLIVLLVNIPLAIVVIILGLIAIKYGYRILMWLWYKVRRWFK